ncbi:jg4790 [Pararge aegeria aegeria]|uniref:Jg4790 protein n=1 Tax=Pararge aegeria aegeria TaxID=348720 RepID=A0A8S4RHE8_9NEOP|nr:jg4790 [Pararge aegeria aegeria]
MKAEFSSKLVIKELINFIASLTMRPQYDVEAILSPHRKTHTRHRSFDRNPIEITNDLNLNNANQNVCLKTVLRNNALEAKTFRIDPTRCQGDIKRIHQRVYSDRAKFNAPAFGSSIKRSSSFNTVSRNNNVEPRLVSRRSSGQSEEYKDSDESDNGSFEKSQDARFKRPLHRGRVEVVPSNSPRCPNTPEMQRKFGPGLVRNSVRVTSKERGLNTRMSEPPVSREDRMKPANHQSRRISEPTRQAVLSRLSKSRSSTREVHPKSQDKVHRSQSFHTTNMADLTLDYSSEETEDDQLMPTLPVDPMITSTHSDILDLRKDMRRQINDVVLARDYVTNFHVNQPPEKLKRTTNRKQYVETTPTKEDYVDKRKTFILDSDTNSTTNGSSPRNSSIFSHEKNSLNTSDTEDSGPESAPVVMRHGKRAPVAAKQRYMELLSRVNERDNE